MVDLAPTPPTSALARELKQARPFRSVGQEALVSLLRTVDLVRRELAAVVEPAGITLQQYNVLRILRGAGEQGLPTLEIAHRMVEQTPGITRLLDRLEEKRLVARERCRQDRRQVLCTIRPTGLELLTALDEPVDRADQEVLAGLTTEQQETLVHLLDRLRAPFQARSPRCPSTPGLASEAKL
jgi:MarR family transcriptional regulator, organic hydroperoxide resistance regulator